MKKILLILIGLSAMLNAEFTRDVNGIVTDSITGLVWQDDAIGSSKTWESAITHCEALRLGGHEDWRLPNLRELTSLVEDTKFDPSIDDVFESTPLSAGYWSSTSDASYSSNAWFVNFGSGYQGYGAKYSGNYARCVRAGQ